VLGRAEDCSISLNLSNLETDCPGGSNVRSIPRKHVNFNGEYTFRDAGDIVDLDQMVSRLAALEWKNALAEQAV
jgi:hypothetical protein